MDSIQEKAWQAVLEALSRRIANNPRGELTAIANEIGATRGTVSRWLSGGLKGRRIPYDKMLRIMRALDIDPALYYGKPDNLATHTYPDASAYLPTRPHMLREPMADAAHLLRTQPEAPAALPPTLPANQPDESAYYQVPWLEAKASMGGGSFEASKKVKSYLSFRRDWLLSKGATSNMVVISVEGDSMSPTIPDGSVVLINEASTFPPVNNRIYFVCYKDELFLKRVRVKDSRVIALISDQDNSEITIQPGEYFNILGRAIWYGKDL